MKKIIQIGNLLPDRKGWRNPQEGRVYLKEGLAPTIRFDSRYWFLDMAKKYRIRKLTPTECLGLMGVRKSEVEKLRQSGISDTQLYKMAGNSIVVDVLMGIFGQMFNPQEKEDENQITFPWW